MKTVRAFQAALTALIPALASCNYSVSKTPENSPATSGGGGVAATTVPGFDTVNTQVIKPKCATCHSAAGGNRAGVNLETYATIKSQLSTIRSAVAGNFMPPASRGPLSAADKALLLLWIDSGGPQDPITAPPPPTGPGAPLPAPPSNGSTNPPIGHCDEDDDHGDHHLPVKHGDDDCRNFSSRRSSV